MLDNIIYQTVKEIFNLYKTQTTNGLRKFQK